MAREPAILNDKEASDLFTNGTLEDVIAFYRAHGNNFQLSFANSNPLHYAVENQDPLVLLYLLKYQNLQSRVNENDDLDNLPLELSAHRGRLKHFEILMFFGADEKLPLKVGGRIADLLAVTCSLPYPDDKINEFKAKRAEAGILLEEAQLEREIERINAKLSAQSGKNQSKTFINQLACSISHWLGAARTPNSPYPAEKSTEQVPLIIKKTM
jgi:hypothetical protein